MSFDLGMELIIILPPANRMLQASHKRYLLTLIYVGHKFSLMFAHLQSQQLIFLNTEALVSIIDVDLSMVCTAARIDLDENYTVCWEADRPKFHRKWANWGYEYILHSFAHQRPV